MNTLDEIKAIIDLYGDECAYGLYDCRNTCGDEMTNVYNKDDVTIDICLDNAYIEVIGLSDTDFNKLSDYYNRNYWVLKDYYEKREV